MYVQQNISPKFKAQTQLITLGTKIYIRYFLHVNFERTKLCNLSGNYVETESFQLKLLIMIVVIILIEFGGWKLESWG